MTDPFRPTDDAARAQARALIDGATFAALAVLQPATALPSVSRIALTTDHDGAPLSLMSDLSFHTAALEAHPACALLIGEPEDKRDPLTHPRLTVHCTARLVSRDAPQHVTLRARMLDTRPKTKLYIDFADFRLVTFAVTDALLNGGFGKAYKLTPADLARRT